MMIALLLAAAPWPAADPQPSPRAAERTWLGADFEVIQLDEAAREIAGELELGIRLSNVYAGYPADRAGLFHGDVLLVLDGEDFGADPQEAAALFREALRIAAPGTLWSLSLLRPGLHYECAIDGMPVAEAHRVLGSLELDLWESEPGTAVELRAVRGPLLVECVVELREAPGMPTLDMPPDEELLPALRARRHPLCREIEKLVDEAGIGPDTADLLERLDALGRRGDVSRLGAVNLALRDPYRLPGICEQLALGFERKALGQRADRILTEACAQLGRVVDADVDRGPSPRPQPPTRGASPEDHLDFAAAVLAEACALREEALAHLSAEDRRFAGRAWRRLGEAFEEHIYLHADTDSRRREENAELLRIGEEVDRGAMLAAADALAPLLDPEWLEILARDLAEAELDLAARTVIQRETPDGWIRIAGTGPDRHRDGDAAVLIDLGGDDYYGNNQASTAGEDEEVVLAVALIADLSGNDAYESTHDGAQAAGVLGAGVLVDLAGDDAYTGLRWCQGVGFMGAGLLLDLAGNDVYRAHALAQGAGLWGAGLLFDLEGDDRYLAHRYGQAVGLAGGAGVLVEREGDDQYYCKGTWPTSYGTAGVFEGWGQGCGVGFRRQASGGAAFLIDEGGRDRYEGGNFSQGGGYYYGLGALLDRGQEDDVYVGSRYNHGFSAHQALGYFRESGGDDRYVTRNAVAHGLAWDECVTFFVEDGGNDTYDGGGFSLGASAHNSVCVFWERRGRDRYLSDAFARAGDNDYHGGTSLSVFIEDGGGKDAYAGEDRNDSEESRPEHGFFIDR